MKCRPTQLPGPDRHRTRGMASLRNLAINALRLAGHTNIATGLRAMARNAYRPLALFGIQA